MKWTVVFHDEFEPEFDELPAEVQDELYAEAGFVELLGPECGRPHVDTLNDSDYANMKELRFVASGALLSRLIRSARQYCWLPATSRVSARRSFTNGS